MGTENARALIGIVDYGMGNLRSVEKALQKAGANTVFVTRKEQLDEVDGLVLPGVGAFGDCVRNLEATGLQDEVRQWARNDRPFFGICLGYQMLFDSSEEAPGVPGLGLLKGKVVRFPAGALKVPQIGWNTIDILKPGAFTEGVVSGDLVYFVHSFYPEPVDMADVALSTTYGKPFAAAIQRGKMFGTQFHPEKSQRVGLQLLGNFVRLVEKEAAVGAQ